MHAERRASLDLRVQRDAAALALDEDARDREPEPDAGHTRRARGASAIEGLEEPLGVLGRHARARVGHRDDGPSSVAAAVSLT